jgi:hypothetical protein
MRRHTVLYTYPQIRKSALFLVQSKHYRLILFSASHSRYTRKSITTFLSFAYRGPHSQQNYANLPVHWVPCRHVWVIEIIRISNYLEAYIPNYLATSGLPNQTGWPELALAQVLPGLDNVIRAGGLRMAGYMVLTRYMDSVSRLTS